MPTSEVIAWISNACFAWGAVCLARRGPVRCQIFNTLGNLFCFLFSITIGSFALGTLSIFLICTNLVGIYNWWKEQKHT